MNGLRILLLISLVLSPLSLPAIAQFSPLCTVTGVLYYADGSLAKNIPVTIVRVQKTGMATVRTPREVRSHATTAVVTFTVPQGSTAWIYARAAIGATNLEVTGGVAFAIPNSSTVTFESLGAAASVPTQGLTIKDEGSSLATLIGTINLVGSGVTATQTTPGTAEINITAGGGGGSGTVTSFSAGDLSPLFTTSEANPTTTPALSFSINAQNANLIFAGPTTGSAAAPTFRSLVAGDIPDLSGVYSIAAHTHTFASLTSKPTTLSGYGITDAALDADLDTVAGSLTTHLTDTANPHAVTKSQVGLGNVANSLQLVAASNLSDLTNAGTARTNLGLVIGTNVQAWDADLDAIAALTPTNDDVLQRKGGAWVNRSIAQLSTDLNLSGTNTGDQDLSTLAPKASPTFTGTATIPTPFTLGAVSVLPTGTELNFVDGVTSSIQTQLDGKQASLGFTAVPDTRTVNGKALSGNITLGLASADFANQGTTSTVLHGNASGNPSFGAVSLTVDVSGDLPFANFVPATAASKLVGRGDSGAGDFQEITIGSGLTMTGTTLSASGGGSQTPWTSAIDGDGFNLEDVGSLIPRAGSILGSATLPWLESWIGNTTQYEKVSQSAGLITHAALGSATNISIALTPKGTGAVTLGTAQILGGNGNVAFSFAVETGTGISRNASVAGLDIVNGGNPVINWGASRAVMPPTYIIGWDSASVTQAIRTAIGETSSGIAEINNGTRGQWGALNVGTRDAGTTTVTNGLTIGHQSTGTPGVGLGSALAFNINSSTTADQAAAQFSSRWQVPTHASRVAYAAIATNAVGTTTLVDRIITGPRTTLVDATDTSLFEVSLPTLAGASGVIDVTIYATDGTDVQVRSQVIRYSSVNKAAAYQTEIVIVSEAASASAGTLTASWSIVTGTNKVTIKVNADTSLASTTSFYCSYTLRNNSDQPVAVL